MSWQRWSLDKGKQYEEAKSEIDVIDLDYITRYMLWREINEDWGNDDQSPGIFSVYKDANMTFLHSRLWRRVEEVTGLSLLPTYTYARMYRPGAILEKHKDRPACEVSATVLVGTNNNPSWPLFIEGERIVQEVGEMAVYRGCDVEHWREPFDAPEGTFHLQLFVHYVDANGPYVLCVNDQDDVRRVGDPHSDRLLSTP